jgi:hypothetical protein
MGWPIFVVSSEKNDMSRQKNDTHRLDRAASASSSAKKLPFLVEDPPRNDRLALAEIVGRGTATTLELPLRCVWTSHLDHEHTCRSQIPVRAVAEAWQRELTLGREQAGFFHFAWRGDVWLAYGLPNGNVRGVYCPVHRAEREQRLGYDPELVIDSRFGHQHDFSCDFDADADYGVFLRAVPSAALAGAG